MTTSPRDYDVIVVGGRVAGASTAMLLARLGRRVLLLERGKSGTDTVSTHALMRAGVMQLQRWGLLDQVIGAGTPPVRHVTFHYGDETLAIEPRHALFAPRRTVLDPIIVDAARRAGVDFRFEHGVHRLLTDADGTVIGVSGTNGRGAHFTATARLVIGADGIRSRVAHDVHAPMYVHGRNAGAITYSYFDGTGYDRHDGYEWIYRVGVTAGIIPTNGGILAWVGTPAADFAAGTGHDRAAYFDALLRAAAPVVADRVSHSTRTERWHSWPGHVGYHRQSWGPGWALVGDAAHLTDPLSAHGLTDALRDAELLTRAVDDWLSGSMAFGHALDRYQRTRDTLSMPLFAAVDRVASYDWDLTEVRELMLAMSDTMKIESDAVADFVEQPLLATR